ncbi:MAG: formimidoylglutamase [Pseudomonadota bacterium]
MYTPPDMKIWGGRIDPEEGSQGRRWHECVTTWNGQATPGVALLGFAGDAGVARNQGRTGAKEGPAAIRRALANLAWHQTNPVYDAGDVICIDDELEATQYELSDHVADLLDAGQFPIVLGGGHEVAYGSFLGLAQHMKTKSHRPTIGIINLDAHFDLRAGLRPNSGTPFRQIAELCNADNHPFHYLVYGIARPSNTQGLFQRAQKLGVVWRTDEECISENKKELLDTLTSFAVKVDWLYLTVCLDVLPAAVAPGVSAPAIRGIELSIVETLIDAVKKTGKLKLAELAELNPTIDRDNQTAKVAARLAWRIAI